MQNQTKIKTARRFHPFRVRYMVITAMMGALSFVLMLLDFPIPIVPSFLRFDFSELPALIAAFSMGPQYGVLVCLIKNLLHLPMTTTAYVGELSNFLLGAIFALVAGLVYYFNKSRKGALWASLAGSTVMGLAAIPVNLWITYPFYATFYFGPTVEEGMEQILAMYRAILPGMHNILECLAVFNVPFTFVKGIAVTLITFLLYKRISPLIKGTYHRKKNASPKDAEAPKAE